MFSPGSGLSVTSPGMLNMCFRHARPRDREHVISSRSSLTWGEQVPMMFSAHNNSSSCMFSFTIFFSMKIQEDSVAIFVSHCFLYRMQKKKKLEIEKGRQEHWRRTLPFFPFTIFSMYVYEDSLSFFSYPISFCSGINTKTEEKKTRNWKGKAGAFETYSYFFFYEHLQRFYIFLFLSYCFLYSDI